MVPTLDLRQDQRVVEVHGDHAAGRIPVCLSGSLDWPPALHRAEVLDRKLRQTFSFETRWRVTLARDADARDSPGPTTESVGYSAQGAKGLLDPFLLTLCSSVQPCSLSGPA